MRGSWRARARSDEPQPEPGKPQCPSWMSAEQKRVYRDALPFDYDGNAVFAFLKEQLKTDIALYGKLFDDGRVQEQPPIGLDMRFAFSCSVPKGAMHLRFFKGKKNDADALIWETMVESVGEDVPKAQKDIPTWVNEAHLLAEDWFFALIEGDLQRKFE